MTEKTLLEKVIEVLEQRGYAFQREYKTDGSSVMWRTRKGSYQIVFDRDGDVEEAYIDGTTHRIFKKYRFGDPKRARFYVEGIHGTLCGFSTLEKSFGFRLFIDTDRQ